MSGAATTMRTKTLLWGIFAVLASSATAWADEDELVEKVVVKNRLFTVEGKFELGASAGITLVSRLTEHYNFQATVAYNIADSFAIELRAGWAYGRHTSLANNVRDQFLTTTVPLINDVSGLWRMGVNGAIGARWQPIYGKISLVAELPVHFQLYVWAGAGGAMLERESVVLCTQGVRSGTMNDLISCSEYFTEQKFGPVASLAAGFRFFITEHHTFRIELRDWSYFDSYYINVPPSSNGPQGGVLASSPGLINIVLLDLGYSYIF